VLAGEKVKNKQCYKIIQKKSCSAARFFGKKCSASWRKMKDEQCCLIIQIKLCSADRYFGKKQC
jgi:hypothetical protein